MNVVAAPFGPVSYTDDEVITFEDGLFGFEHLHRFVSVSGGSESLFSYLQSLDDASVTFVVCVPRNLFPEYHLTLPRHEAAGLDLSENDTPIVLAICTVPEKVEDITINLLGPLLINPKTKKGRQVIDQNPQFGTRHKVFSETSGDLAAVG